MPVNAENFWDRIADKYSRQPIADEDSYQRKLAESQSLMKPTMKVLELGCGTGSTAIKHAPYVAEFVATDVSAAMIEIGIKRAKEAGIHNVTFKQSGVEDFDGKEGSYDMILALSLLHLLPDRPAAITKIHRLLKPGGFFISSTVCLSDRMWFMRPIIPVMQWLDKAPYVEFLKAENVRNEISQAGFIEQNHWTHGRSNSLFLIAKKSSKD